MKKLSLACLSVLLIACGGDNNRGSRSNDDFAPVLTEVSSIVFGRDTTPDYIFSSSEKGTIIYGGDCSSQITLAQRGENTITFNKIPYGTHSNCTIRVKDKAGNISTELLVSDFTIVPKPLNDTGITLCGDYAYDDAGYTGSGIDNNDLDCESGASPSSTATQEGFEIANGMDSVPAGQDVHFGRDADPRTNDDADGHKGFSYTKVCNSGELAGEGSCPVNPALGSGANDWACTLDNVTGLLWEVKTDDGGLRDKDWTYSWFNTESSNNGGHDGYADFGDNCSNTSRCDTEKYVADVNAAGLCGATDWRLPNRTELLGIVSNSRINPTVDTVYFPNTVNVSYTTSSPSAGNAYNVWLVNFYRGNADLDDKSNTHSVRVVSGE